MRGLLESGFFQHLPVTKPYVDLINPVTIKLRERVDVFKVSKMRLYFADEKNIQARCQERNTKFERKLLHGTLDMFPSLHPKNKILR